MFQVVDARAGPGTKSFVKIKSKKNKRKSKGKKQDEDEEMEDEIKKVTEPLPCVDYNLNEDRGRSIEKNVYIYIPVLNDIS